jgi:hypothetical protein
MSRLTRTPTHTASACTVPHRPIPSGAPESQSTRPKSGGTPNAPPQTWSPSLTHTSPAPPRRRHQARRWEGYLAHPVAVNPDTSHPIAQLRPPLIQSTPRPSKQPHPTVHSPQPTPLPRQGTGVQHSTAQHNTTQHQAFSSPSPSSPPALRAPAQGPLRRTLLKAPLGCVVCWRVSVLRLREGEVGSTMALFLLGALGCLSRGGDWGLGLGGVLVSVSV